MCEVNYSSTCDKVTVSPFTITLLSRTHMYPPPTRTHTHTHTHTHTQLYQTACKLSVGIAGRRNTALHYKCENNFQHTFPAGDPKPLSLHTHSLTHLIMAVLQSGNIHSITPANFSAKQKKSKVRTCSNHKYSTLQQNTTSTSYFRNRR